MADSPHPQVESLLQLMEQRPVPPTFALSVPQAREQMAELFTDMGAEEVPAVEDFSIEGPDGPLDVRLYLPDGDGPHPTLVFFHGGGFVLGDLDTHDNICRALTNAAECAVLSVDYRLAPEHPFPAAVEDAYAAVKWVAQQGDRAGLDPERIAVGGDSAGGNLSAATTLVARDRGGPAIAHQVLVYPAVSSPILEEPDSYEENATGYFLERESMQWFTEKYVQHAAHHRNEYFAPLLVEDYSGLPSASVLTAGFDPLRDEGQQYAAELAEDGVSVTEHHYEEMIHGFVSMIGMVDAATDAIDALATDLRAAFES